MRTLSLHPGPHVPKTFIATILTAATLLVGCALEPTPAYARSTPGCGLNAVLFCDLSPHGERCECVRHGELRDLTRTLISR